MMHIALKYNTYVSAAMENSLTGTLLPVLLVFESYSVV